MRDILYSIRNKGTITDKGSFLLEIIHKLNYKSNISELITTFFILEGILIFFNPVIYERG